METAVDSEGVWLLLVSKDQMKKQEEGRDERRARRSDYQEDCHCANTTRLLACDLVCAPASWCLVGYLLIAVIYLYYYTLLLSEQYSMQYIGWK